MLKDEFDRLIKLFRDSAEGKQVNVEGVFQEALRFFEHLKEQIATGSPEDKKQAVLMMTRMYQEMMQETKKIAARSGMTEEQLAAFAENPVNFSKEQWESLKSSKEQIQHVGEEIVKGMQKQIDPSAQSPKKEEGKKPPKDKHDRHSKWIRS